MNKKLKQIANTLENSADRSLDAMKNLEQKVQSLNENTKKNKIIIWSIAAVIATIIIFFRS